jgi:hypothetical protein
MLADVRFGSKADMCTATVNVRFGPKADIVMPIQSTRPPVRATRTVGPDQVLLQR